MSEPLRMSGETTIAEMAAAFRHILRVCESPPEHDLWLHILDAAVLLLCVEPDREITIEAQYPVTRLGYRLDFLVTTRGRRLAFECDGLAFHGDQAAFARDRKRDRDLAAAGIETFRFTAVEIIQSTDVTQREVYGILAKALLS